MLQAILDAIAAPVAALGRSPATGRLVVEAANAALAGLLGQAPGGLAGWPAERLLPPGLADAARDGVGPGAFGEVRLGPEGGIFRAALRPLPGTPFLLATFLPEGGAERPDPVGRRLAESEARLRLALEAGGLGVWESDLASGRVRFDPVCLTRLGWEPGDGTRSLAEAVALIHPRDRVRVRAAYEQCRRGAVAQVRLEYRVRRRDGGHAWIEEHAIVAEHDAAGRPLRIVGVSADITARKEAELRLEHLALHDPLTGLPNRRALAEALERAVARARRSGQPLAVLALDLDGFKAVNDRHGHPAGDAALAEVAARLRRAVRRSDVVARLGGDEFAVVAGELLGPTAATRLARRIETALTAPMRLGEATASLGVSIGVAFFPGDGETPEALLGHADRALYARKRERGRSRLVAASPATG